MRRIRCGGVLLLGLVGCDEDELACQRALRDMREAWVDATEAEIARVGAARDATSDERDRLREAMERGGRGDVDPYRIASALDDWEAAVSPVVDELDRALEMLPLHLALLELPALRRGALGAGLSHLEAFQALAAEFAARHPEVEVGVAPSLTASALETCRALR
jgi:hypothetical protein